MRPSAGPSPGSLSGPEALLSNLQLWKSSALFPRLVSCPRHVCDAKPHPADPYTGADHGPSPAVKRALAAGPSSAFHHGPVDSLESTSFGGHDAPHHHGLASWASPSRKHARTSHQGAAAGTGPSSSSGGQHLTPQASASLVPFNSTNTPLATTTSGGSGRGRRGGPAAGRHGPSNSIGHHQRQRHLASLSSMEALHPDSQLDTQQHEQHHHHPLPVQHHLHIAMRAHQHQQPQQLCLEPAFEQQLYTDVHHGTGQQQQVEEEVDVTWLESHPRSQRRGVARRRRADMEQFCASFVDLIASPEPSPAPSMSTHSMDAQGAGAGPFVGLASSLLLPSRQEVSSAEQQAHHHPLQLQHHMSSSHNPGSEDPSTSASLSVSMQSTDTLKGRPLSPSSPLSDGLF